MEIARKGEMDITNKRAWAKVAFVLMAATLLMLDAAVGAAKTHGGDERGFNIVHPCRVRHKIQIANGIRVVQVKRRGNNPGIQRKQRRANTEQSGRRVGLPHHRRDRRPGQ